jgi:hypothetical protein
MKVRRAEHQVRRNTGATLEGKNGQFFGMPRKVILSINRLFVNR